MDRADLPLIQILSVYTDFLTLEFGKIQIFHPKIRRNTDFFSGMPKVFPYTVHIHTDFFPNIQIFLVNHTDFASDHSGRSDRVNKSILVGFYRLTQSS